MKGEFRMSGVYNNFLSPSGQGHIYLDSEFESLLRSTFCGGASSFSKFKWNFIRNTIKITTHNFYTAIRMEAYLRTRRSPSKNEDQHISVKAIIESPISYGYLLLFCQKEHNAENVKFLADVMQFREIFSMDKGVWRDSWRNIDKEISDYVINIENGEEEIVSSWPSKQIDRREVQSAIGNIFKNYLSDGKLFFI